MNEDGEEKEEIEKIKEASREENSASNNFYSSLNGFQGFLKSFSAGPGHWLKEVFFDRKALPFYFLLGALYASSFRKPNFLFRDGAFNEQLLAGKLQAFISVFNESFVLGSPVRLITTLFFIGTVWSIYRFWLRDVKMLEQSYGLLRRILIVLVGVLVLYRHVRQGSVLEQFSQWIVFALVLYLELAISWFLMRTIDHIDLSSDLKNWTLRLLGLPTVFAGSTISLGAQPLITFSYTPELYGNNVFLAGILVMILGGFMIYRSTRRQPALKIW
ncbi:hypothetical protein AQV86_04740 [Nanohaloarchaea archaeon SG9]|nr:hypothetical protein AQV86_04740 [Nanohaloarchaea archaeon SG9]